MSLLAGLQAIGFKPEIRYRKAKSAGFMDLVVERIGPSEFSFAHYYVQNGDLMKDPEVTFKFTGKSDPLTGEIVAVMSFQQDNLGIHQHREEMTLPQLRSLEKFFGNWLRNLKDQGFNLELSEEIND